MPATFRIADNPKGTFVLLHGIGGWKDQRVMRAIIDPVYESGYNVVSFDAADGANAPDANSLTGTTTGYRKDLEDVVAHIENEPWYAGPLSLGGHSLGALVATEYAAAHSGVERLILAAPGISWKEYQYILPVGSWWLIRGKVRMPGPELKHYWLGRPWLDDFLTHDLKKLAPAIKIPTLVAIGSRDGLVGTVKTHERFANLFPNGAFRIIRRADHTFHPHEEALTATIRQWLTSL
jgi:pimeloyl-ACP methyl ester carboxylesterase